MKMPAFSREIVKMKVREIIKIIEQDGWFGVRSKNRPD